jgi:transposase-like protein
MKSTENYPMAGIVHADEFTSGGKEEGKKGRSYDVKKKKIVCAIELTNKGKVKRFYALKIKDFSAKSLRKIFDKHITQNAQVTTDEWKGYRPIAKTYNIAQIPSKNGANFKALHTIIHQVKSWIRTTFSWVSEFNIDRYLNEFCYRLNRSQNKDTIFNNLIRRMVNSEKIYQSELICR